MSVIIRLYFTAVKNVDNFFCYFEKWGIFYV